MGMEWFYANGGNRTGPVTPLAFESLVRDSIVKPETLVWAKGMADWLPYGQVVADTAICASAGGRHWQRDMVPYEGKFISAEHKDQFFQRLREGVTQPGQMAYAGFWLRFLAKVVDMIVGWVIGTVINLGLAMLFFGNFIFMPKATDPAVMGRFFAYNGTSFLVGLTVGIVYNWFFLSRYAGTPGKLAVGLKIVRSDGSPLSTGRIIGRYFAEWISGLFTLGIGYIMAGFDDERRALHDRICDTRVIKSR